MLPLTPEELVAQAFAVLLPLVVAVIVRPTWSERTRALVAFAVTVVVAAMTRLALMQVTDLPRDWQGWLQFVMVTLVISAVSYQSFWKQTGLVQRIEAGTSPTTTRAQQEAVRALRNEANAKSTTIQEW